jgi:hypothetical protein
LERAYLALDIDVNPHLKMLEKVIKENSNVLEIEWNVSDDMDAEGKDWAYIDHASSAVEDQNMEIFESEEVLKNFIFGSGSHIELDNDNR